MKIDHALCFAILIAISEALHAQSCAGGVGGGMDATGNECSDSRWQTDYTAPVAVPIAVITAAPNVRPVEQLASGALRAPGKLHTAALAGVEERHLAKQGARASPSIARADGQLGATTAPRAVPR
jgi:hypothetical protein